MLRTSLTSSRIMGFDIICLIADDMQGYCSGRLGDVHAMASRIERCISDLRCQEIATKRRQDRSALVRTTITAPSALVRQFSHHHKSEHHQTVVRRPWSGHLVWRWAVNAPPRLMCVRRASFICAAYAQSVVNSVATSLPSWLQLLCCHALTTATLFLRVCRRWH